MHVHSRKRRRLSRAGQHRDTHGRAGYLIGSWQPMPQPWPSHDPMHCRKTTLPTAPGSTCVPLDLLPHTTACSPHSPRASLSRQAPCRRHGQTWVLGQRLRGACTSGRDLQNPATLKSVGDNPPKGRIKVCSWKEMRLTVAGGSTAERCQRLVPRQQRPRKLARQASPSFVSHSPPDSSECLFLAFHSPKHLLLLPSFISGPVAHVGCSAHPLPKLLAPACAPPPPLPLSAGVSTAARAAGLELGLRQSAPHLNCTDHLLSASPRAGAPLSALSHEECAHCRSGGTV